MFTRGIRSAALGLTIVAGLSGCGDSGSKGGGGSGGGTGGGSGNPTGLASDLQGTWQSNCVRARDIGYSQISRLSVDGSSFNDVAAIGASGTCETAEIEVVTSGSFARQNEVRPSVFALDVSASSVRVRPLTARGADVLTISRWCGISDWAQGVERDVTGSTGRDGCFDKVPSTLYTIYSIEGNQLLFGKEGGSKSAANRPVELERDETFTRQ